MSWARTCKQCGERYWAHTWEDANAPEWSEANRCTKCYRAWLEAHVAIRAGK